MLILKDKEHYDLFDLYINQTNDTFFGANPSYVLKEFDPIMYRDIYLNWLDVSIQDEESDFYFGIITKNDLKFHDFIED